MTLPKPRPATHVRNRLPEDIPEIRALMSRAYPPPHGPEAIWSETTLAAHLAVFPEGQWVALDAGGQLVASATAMRVASSLALAPHTWADITGRGQLTTHDPAGDALYGVNIVVDPRCQGQGYARLLYDARVELARRLGCRWIIAGARIPGYHHLAERLSPEAYVEAVVRGEVFDPTLSKQLKVGFQVRGVLRDYAYDHETHNHAALITYALEPEYAI